MLRGRDGPATVHARAPLCLFVNTRWRDGIKKSSLEIWENVSFIENILQGICCRSNQNTYFWLSTFKINFHRECVKILNLVFHENQVIPD